MNRPTLAQLFEKYPPFLLYALAKTRRTRMSREERRRRYSRKNTLERRKSRKKRWQTGFYNNGWGWRHLTHQEIGLRGGLTARRVKHISGEIVWDRISVMDALKFMKGCGVEFTRVYRVNYYLRTSAKPRALALATLNPKQYKHFAKLCGRLAALRKIEQAEISTNSEQKHENEEAR